MAYGDERRTRIKGELRRIALALPGCNKSSLSALIAWRTLDKLPIEIPEVERTPLVNWLLNLVASQQEIIEKQQQKIAKLSEKVNSLDEELKAAKKLKGKPKIAPSTLNLEEKKPKEGGGKSWFG